MTIQKGRYTSTIKLYFLKMKSIPFKLLPIIKKEFKDFFPSIFSLLSIVYVGFYLILAMKDLTVIPKAVAIPWVVIICSYYMLNRCFLSFRIQLNILAISLLCLNFAKSHE